MTKEYDVNRIAKKLRRVSPEVDDTSAFSKKEDGIQPFHFWTKRALTTAEMISICRDMAIVIRRDIPERPDGWAASIYAANAPVKMMGVYFIGWAGHADQWHLMGKERKATDDSDWQTFRNRLREAVAALGTEGEEGDGSDFEVMDKELAPLKQILFVHKPEFLTKELIVTVQTVIKDCSGDGVVNIAPTFGEDVKTVWKGIDVLADDVEELWDRKNAEKLFGDRLKYLTR